MLAGRIERNVLAGLSIIDGLDQGGRALRWAITKGEWDVRRNYAAIPVKWAWGSAGLTRLLAGRAHLGALLTTIEGPYCDAAFGTHTPDRKRDLTGGPHYDHLGVHEA